MPPTPTVYSRRELVAQAMRRMITYTDQVTYFGANSAEAALVETIGGSAAQAFGLYKALQRRFTLLGSSGEALVEVAAERGAKKRAAQRARLLVILVPWSTSVTAITVGLTTAIEVVDSAAFAVGDSIRIRNVDGSVTERVSILSISTATGPTGGDELVVGSLGNTYTPSGDDVQVLLRHTIPLETVITTKAGIGFRTTTAVTIGDFNPVLSGESPALALADKVWCEALTKGSAGNVDPNTVSGLQVADTDVRALYNPERGFGGADEETDHDLRYRAAHLPSRRTQETLAWAEALAVEADVGVLRAVTTPPTAISTLEIKLLGENGGPLQLKRLAAVDNYIAARVRSYMAVRSANVDLVAIEIEAQVEMDPDVPLRRAWIDASARCASYLDYRRWPFGQTVDWLELLRIIGLATGVRSVMQSSFLPAGPVVIPSDGLPVLVRVSMQDLQTLQTINGSLAVSFASSGA